MDPLFRTVDLFGFYVSPVVVWALAALVPHLALSRLAAWSGLYGLIWHRPLFDAALYVILLGALIFGVPVLLGETM
ncbi:DUF1656 domain-containing protein [Ancylobacter oerskovii]|uniref:DUF1656 domain-containing protein n=1 Tax=Ancylobacter oerskovii TaxID=459519 RepID=A0ABW4Z4T5_9HYPH|nr:DUF1656 domain-containing protein [Ancylobacter oerskovii]MBS7544037.1 DUF1656 domain-containing protein [Ancylobacter oerskovii]